MVAGARYGVDIRAALPADAAEISVLLQHLGTKIDTHRAAERLDVLARERAGTVLVATGPEGRVIGLIALHWYAVLHQDRPVARITTLVVDDRHVRSGIGRLLLKAGAQAARMAGCDVMEAAAGQDAERAFYRASGFAESMMGYARSLRRRSSET